MPQIFLRLFIISLLMWTPFAQAQTVVGGQTAGRSTSPIPVYSTDIYGNPVSAGTVGINQTTPGTTNGVVVNAGSNVIGYMGSLNFGPITITPTLGFTSYTAGMCLGGLQPVPVFRNTTQPSATLSQLMLSWLDGETTSVVVYAFKALPTGTYTDHVAFSLTASDAKLLIAPPFTLTPTAPTGSTAAFAAQTLSLSVKNQDSIPTTNLYFLFVAVGAATPASSSLLYASISGVND